MDSLLIEQVLVNLLDNSLKYTPPKSPIEISARGGKGQLVVEVADRGPGLPEEDLIHLFDKFYRGPQDGRTSGAGLGLSICKGFIQIHGGTITAQNRPGGGALFRLTLPLESNYG
jgi:two-component system sensor histidine kinase KdpD